MNKSTPLDAHRMAVFTAAIEFSKNSANPQNQKQLLMAADEYAKARWNEHPKSAPPKHQSQGSRQQKPADVVPFGRDAGKKVSALTLNGLLWVHDALLKSLDEPKYIGYRDRNEALLKSIYADLARRGVTLESLKGRR